VFVPKGTSADRVHLQNTFQKDATVRYAGRNMFAGRMQKTPTNKPSWNNVARDGVQEERESIYFLAHDEKTLG
jgi:hypothetical protein